MARLFYGMIMSLDGYASGPDGGFDWALDPGVHAFITARFDDVGTYLYGRRMYETMRYWQSPPPADSDIERDYAAIWQAADKIVYSRTIAEPAPPRTRVEAEFDAETVRRLKAGTESDLSIGGAELAGQALAAGLVDEVQLFLNPVVVGGGKAALPDGVRLRLELVDERRFGNGVVFVRYRVRD